MEVTPKVKDNRSQLKSRVLEYAKEAFNVYGIKDVTMDSIASGLSVSKRTLYELFGDKEGLLLEVVKIHYDESRQFINQVLSKSDNVLDVIFTIYERNVQEIRKANKVFFEEIHKYPSVIHYLQTARKEMASITMFYFNKGVSQNLFRDDVNYEIIRTAIVEEMGILLRSELSEKYSLVEIYEQLVLLHMRGVATEKGLKKVDDFFASMKTKKTMKKITITNNSLI